MVGILWYVVISFLFAYLIDFAWLLPNSSNALSFQIGGAIRMLTPLIAVLLIKFLRKDSFSRFDIGLCIGKPIWLMIAPLIPLIVLGLTVVLHKLFSMPVNSIDQMIELMWQPAKEQISDDPNALVLYQWMKKASTWGFLFIIITSLIAGVTINAVFGMGEEIGWRGYLIHRLIPHNFYLQTIAIGIIWGLWHAPLIAILGYNYSGQTGIVPLLIFLIFTVSTSFVLNNIRYLSGSIIPPALTHGTLNALGGIMLITFPENPLLSGPAGVIPSIAWLITGVVLDLIRRKSGVTRCETSEEPEAT